jgi:hypothetical protein
MDRSQLEPTLNDAMAALGWTPAKARAFRAPWSTEQVEHYLYWKPSFQGTSLSFDFGLRNIVSEAYARDCACLYGGLERRRLQRAFADHRCYMTQFLARLTPDARQMIIGYRRMSEAELRSTVTDIVQARVRPALSSITSLEALRAFLVSGDDRCPWWATSGVIRAAKIVKLGRMLGTAPHDIETSLAGREDDIQRGLRLDRTARDYIANILAHDAAEAS